jgi:RNase P/RNase MRP subunit p29
MTDDVLKLPKSTVQRSLVGRMEARLQGILAVDETTNCLVIQKAGRHIDVAWPRGWTVAIRDRSIALLDASGQSVARLGDAVSITGGYVPSSAADTTSCTGSEKVFAVSSLRLPSM